MAVMKQKFRSAKAFCHHLKKREVETEYFHICNAAATVAFDRYLELRPVVGRIDNETTQPILIEIGYGFGDDKNRLIGERRCGSDGLLVDGALNCRDQYQAEFLLLRESRPP